MATLIITAKLNGRRVLARIEDSPFITAMARTNGFVHIQLFGGNPHLTAFNA